MVDVLGQEGKLVAGGKEKSLAEKYLEDKRNAALGKASSNHMGSRNPMVGRSGFGGKSGGGKPTIRKHAARSR